MSDQETITKPFPSDVALDELDEQAIPLDGFPEYIQVRAGNNLVPHRSFLDEIIDVNCTPQGQDVIDVRKAEDMVFDAWRLVGECLSYAMFLDKGRHTWPIQR